jgi:hypothetical protein
MSLRKTIPVYVRFEVLTPVSMKNAVVWDVKPCGLHHQGDKNRRARNNVSSVFRLLVTAIVLLPCRFLSTWWWRRYVPKKRRFLQEPHGVTSQKTPFFIATAVKTSNLTYWTFFMQRSIIIYFNSPFDNVIFLHPVARSIIQSFSSVSCGTFNCLID